MTAIKRFFSSRLKDPEQIRFERLANRLESPIERIFWVTSYPKLSKLGKFTPQTKIRGYRADFTLTDIPNGPFLNIVIETDGHDCHSTPAQRDYDTQRDRVLLKAGWLVIRFTGSQIYGDCPGCVAEVVDLVREWSK